MVWPDMLVTTSPGLLALPSGMFSVAGTTPTTLMAGAISATAAITPSTLAAPVISNFISSIAGPGFSEMPPESKVTPLPTSTMGLAPSSRPLYSRVMSFALWREPRVTDSSAPMPSASMSASSSTW